MKLSLSTSLSGFTKSAVPFVGALDDFNPDMAWSHRRALVSSFTGNLLQARRMSDDTPYDVPVKADGEGDFDSLLSFLGSESAAVTQLSEQMGGHHLLQGTADNQRIIVDAGSLVTVGGKAAAKAQATGGKMFSSVLGTSYTGNVASVFMRGAHPAYVGLVYDPYFALAQSGAGSGASYPGMLMASATDMQITWIGDTTGPIETDYLLSLIWDGTNVTMRDGTNTYSMAASSAFDFNQVVLGAIDGLGNGVPRTDHAIQELAVWLSDQTANEAAIRSALLA